MKIIGFNLNSKKEGEDFFLYKQEGSRVIMCVADGITRDPIGMPYLSEKSWENYPKYSPARKAAIVFCKSFIEAIEQGKKLEKSFEYANSKIKVLNKQLKLGKDYLEKDYAACVASGTLLSKGSLSWGFVTDCGLCIFNSKGLKFRTENMMKNTEEYVKKVCKKEGKTWKQPETRAWVRGELRNKNLLIDKKEVGYGAFTGEKEALNFLQLGKHKIFPQDYVFLYSDGAEPIIFSKEFEKNLKINGFNGLQRFCKEKAQELKAKEATIVGVLI